MGIREIEIAGQNIVIHELDDVCDSVTGRTLTGSWVWDSALVLSKWISTQLDFQGKSVLELGDGLGLPSLGIGRLTELGVFDVVLMSDVFLTPEEMVGLVETLKRVCGGGGGTTTRVWAACEVRAWTGECLSELVSRGFGVVEFPSQLGPASSCSLSEERDGRLDMFAMFNLIPPVEESCHVAMCLNEKEQPFVPHL